MNYTHELLQLIKEHPDLPIVPMVAGDIAADDDGYWAAAWGEATVDEYLIADRYERILFKSDYDMYEVLDLYLSPQKYDSLKDEAECRKEYDSLPWEKAIIVYIEASATKEVS